MEIAKAKQNKNSVASTISATSARVRESMSINKKFVLFSISYEAIFFSLASTLKMNVSSVRFSRKKCGVSSVQRATEFANHFILRPQFQVISSNKNKNTSLVQTYSCLVAIRYKITKT